MVNLVHVGGHYKGMGDIISDAAFSDIEGQALAMAMDYGANASNNNVIGASSANMFNPTYGLYPNLPPPSSTVSKNLIYGAIGLAVLFGLMSKR